MNALTDLFASLLAPYLDWPLLSSIVSTLVALGLALATSAAVYRFVSSIAKKLSPGPVFLFSALVVALGYVVLLVYTATTGRSFEAATVAWLTGYTSLPLDTLGIYQRPLLLSVLYFILQAAYLGIAIVMAWLLGLFSPEREESVAREIEAELGTSLAMRFYRLAGYHRPDAPEKRFHAYATELVRALGWARWLSLPAVFTGALPVALWVVGSIVHDGMAQNLTPPPQAPEEEKRDEESELAALPLVRDPAALVRALQNDTRGPQLNMLGGGMLEGAAEHAAEKTRVRDESAIMAEVLGALGIESFYVHQEAAAEAVLAGEDVLMETSPLSGRRTLCDVLAMRAVLLAGKTVLYISPSGAESARRARAFREVAQRSNWRWAIFHHDMARDGREGLDLKLRQPQIVFTTPEELHADICRLHRDWDYFLSSLALVVSIDLDRYTGPRGAGLMYLMRRLARVAAEAGASPQLIATVAPYGPDVQGFAERLIGRPLAVVGPESNSRGAPPQYVVVGAPAEPQALHEAVAARGVAIASGYHTEIWGHGAVLTDFEQEQQVNKVLLSFSKAVVAPGDGTDSRFDQAHAIVARLSSDKAAMLPFFTRHTGRKALGVASLRAQEIGARDAAGEEEPASPFAGFARHEEAIDVGVKEKVARGEAEVELDEDGAAPDEAEAMEALLAAQPELAVAIWLPDDDAFARLLARHPQWVHPSSLHPMLELGSRLVTSVDNPSLTLRHLLAAASETPLRRSEATRLFSAEALDALLADRDGSAEAFGLAERLSMRPRLRLDGEGVISREEELVLDGELMARGSTEIASLDVTSVENRAGGEHVMQIDTVRALSALYPGRIFVRRGRRYRVIDAREQDRMGEGVLLVEPERRRIVTQRIRALEVGFEGEGHALSLGGERNVRFQHAPVSLRETVIGVQQRQRARNLHDALHYDAPIEVAYRTRAAIVELPDATPEAFEALERLVRVTLPAFVHHDEEDIDVSCQNDGRLLFVDRHPGGAGYARAITTEVLRHVFYWSREIVARCGGPACAEHDGCQACVYGTPRLTPVELRGVSQKAVLALLDSLVARR